MLVRLAKPFFDGKETYLAGVHNLPDDITLPTSAKKLSSKSPEALSIKQVEEAKAKAATMAALSDEIIALQEELAVTIAERDDLAAKLAEATKDEPTAKVAAKSEDKK